MAFHCFDVSIYHYVCEFFLPFFISVKHVNDSSSSTEIISKGKLMTCRMLTFIFTCGRSLSSQNLNFNTF